MIEEEGEEAHLPFLGVYSQQVPEQCIVGHRGCPCIVKRNGLGGGHAAVRGASGNCRSLCCSCRQHAAEMEQRILDDRQSCLENLLRDVATADEAFRKQRAAKIHAWQEELAQLKKSREARKSQAAANS